MSRTLLVLVLLLPAAILLIQGGGCLRGARPRFVRGFGALAIALAGLDVVLALLLVTGTLIPSREFGSLSCWACRSSPGWAGTSPAWRPDRRAGCGGC
jgi:hypothetical protein